MKRMRWIPALLVATLLCGANLANAQNGYDHGNHNHKQSEAKTTTGPHDGQISRAGDHWCEVVFQSKSVRVYLYDSQGQPLSAKGVRGAVTMKVAGNPKQYRYDLYPDARADAKPSSLYLAINLSKIPDGGMSTEFSILGLPGSGRRPHTFAQTFHLTGNSEQLAIARQKICPVSGKKLGLMGRPVKTTVNGRDVYVCCRGCTNALQKDPAKYLARISDPAPAKATKADEAAIARQKMCPVTDEPLDSMGVPWKVYAKGRPIFLCCKGCIKKIQANPDFYLAKTARLTDAGRTTRR